MPKVRFHFLVLSILSVSIAWGGPTHLKTDLGLLSEYSENLSFKNQILGLEALFQLDSELAKQLLFKSEAGFQLETGFGQNQFDNPYQAQNGFVFHEASLNWNPSQWFEWHVGGLNQKIRQPFSLIQKGAFPGSFERFKLDIGRLTLSLRGHQSLPMSDDSVLPQKQGTPWLLQTGFDSRVGFEKTSFELGIDHMKFINLSRGAADKGRFLGNSTVMSSPNTSTFAYAFENILLHGEFAQSFLNRKLETSIRAEYGDSFRNPSQYFRLTPQVKWDINSNLSVSLNASLLAIESDFFPGVYLDKATGPANSRGWQTELSVFFPKNRLSVSGELANLQPINANINQARFTYALLKLVHSYDLF